MKLSFNQSPAWLLKFPFNASHGCSEYCVREARWGKKPISGPSLCAHVQFTSSKINSGSEIKI